MNDVLAAPVVDKLNPLAPGTRLSEFVIERVLGAGGFGIVYQANDTTLHRTVAIKEYLPTSMATRGDGLSVDLRAESFSQDFELGKATFIEEAKMLARFKHPALLEVFRYWEANQTAYIVTPFYKGSTLKERLRAQSGLLHEAELKLVLLPVLDALEHMHAQQVYHRDISPDNIMVLEDGTPILLDLGAARRFEEKMTQSFTVLVKPGYAPIEQYAGDAAHLQGPWTDLYGWAASAYFALVGKPPPPAASRVMNDSIIKLVGLRPPGYSHDFLAAVDAALAVRPDDRPQSVRDLKTLLALETPADQVPEYVAPNEATTFARDPAQAVYRRRESATAVSPEPASLVATSTENQPAEATFRLAPTALLALGMLLLAGLLLWSNPNSQNRASQDDNSPLPQSSAEKATGPDGATDNVTQAPAKSVAASAATLSASTDISSAGTSASGPAGNLEPAKSDAAETQSANKPALARLGIKPWGEVFVNGERRGVSPPLKSLSLPAGDYNLEIRNGDYPAFRTKLKLKAGQQIKINHAFDDALKK